MNERQIAHYEDGRMLANRAMWTIELQLRRLDSKNLEIEAFEQQALADFQFLLIALDRLEKSANLVNSAVDISEDLNMFCERMPWLRKLRNAQEHIDEYQQGKGRDRSIDIAGLHVFHFGQNEIHWLDEKIDLNNILSTSNQLFGAIKMAAHNKIKNENANEVGTDAA